MAYCYTETSHSQNSLFVYVQTGLDFCDGPLNLVPTKCVESTGPFKLKIDLCFALTRKSTGDKSISIINICLSSRDYFTIFPVKVWQVIHLMYGSHAINAS